MRNLDRDGMGAAVLSVVKGGLERGGMRVSSHIRRKGELFRDGNVLSSPPLEGWRLAAGVVRECGVIHLVP